MRSIETRLLSGLMAGTIALILSSASAASEQGYRLGLSDQWTHSTFQLADHFEPRVGTSSRLSPIFRAYFEEDKSATRPKVSVDPGHTVFDLRDEHFGSATWLPSNRHSSFSSVFPKDKRFSRSRWHIRWKFTLLGPGPGVGDYGWRDFPG